MKLLRDVVKKRTDRGDRPFNIYRCPSCMFVTYSSIDAERNAQHSDECENFAGSRCEECNWISYPDGRPNRHWDFCSQYVRRVNETSA